MNEILNIIHKTIYQFFDVCEDDEEVPMSDKDKLLLEVNKAICNNLKALEQKQKWIPVSERLPEENEEYHSFFVTDSNYDISIAKFYLPLNPDIDRPYWSGLIDVIAWMPIFIEPYKEESEDKE